MRLRLWVPVLAILALVLLLVSAADLNASSNPSQLSAAQIMKRVAQNQDRAQSERCNYVYEQSVRVVIRRKNGKPARDETTRYSVAPEAKATKRTEESVFGSYWKKGRKIDFKGEPVPEGGGIDAGLAHAFRDLVNDDSKDGLGKDLFPLTTDAQKDLAFQLEGEETVSGRKAYRIKFGPANRHDFTWAGEALIDEQEFQPVSVYTRLSRKIPLAVRTLLGTDVPGLGFNTQYKRIDKDVWFPVSFGTEFRLRAVFFLNRVISVSMQSRDFKRASVTSDIQYQDSSTPPIPH